MAGPKLASIAWRNLWRNRRRTFITLFGISFGVFLAVIFTGIGDSTYGRMIDMAAAMGTGHVIVQHEDYLEAPSLQKTVANASKVEREIKKDPQVTNTAMRVSGQTMLATASGSYGALFFAIDPERETVDTLSILEGKLDGDMLSNADDEGIVVGAKLLKNLDARVGSKIVYTLTDTNGEIVSGLARVRGSIKTGSDTMDSALCLFGLNTLRKLLGYSDDAVTQIAVFIDDQRYSEKTAARLEPLVGKGSTAISWKEASPDLDAFITMKLVSTEMFEYIIMILVVAGIFNTLLVSVLERMREFGIMSAIGFSPGKLFSLVMWESFFLGISGLALCAVLGAWPYYKLVTVGMDFSSMYGEETVEVAGVGMSAVIYADIYMEHAIVIGVSALLATLVAGIYPAIKAGNVAPVETIKLV